LRPEAQASILPNILHNNHAQNGSSVLAGAPRKAYIPVDFAFPFVIRGLQVQVLPRLPFLNCAFCAACIFFQGVRNRDLLNRRATPQQSRRLCLRTTSCPKTPVLAQKPEGYWFTVKKRIIESEIAARLTAGPSTDPSNLLTAYIFVDEMCANSVPNYEPTTISLQRGSGAGTTARCERPTLASKRRG
jgi:hypothetical protein